jgi:AraC-like DNA-binding protein
MRIYRILLLLLSLFSLMALPVCADEEERSFKVINAANGLADNSAQIVKCTKTGRLIISTIGNLNFYDGKTFSHANSRGDDAYRLPEYHGHFHLYFDTAHHIWLKDKAKVYCLDLMTERFIHNVDSVIKGMGCKDRVLDLFVDQKGNVWFLTPNGLFSPSFKNRLKVQQNKNLHDVDIHNGVVYMFYYNGEVIGTDTLGNNVCHTQAYDWQEGQRYSSSSVLMPYQDGFFQIRNGDKESILLYFDAKEKRFETLLKLPYHINNMVLNPAGDKLYIPAEQGYLVYTIATKEMVHQELLTLSTGGKLKTDCNTLAFDLQGGMWIGTEKRGVLYARPHSLAFKVYRLGTEEAEKYDRMLDGVTIDEGFTEYMGTKAYCKMLDSRGWRWIGTRKGLFVERPGEQKPLSFTKSHGLNNDVVHSVIEDNDHNVWIATSCGITFFLIREGKITFINNFTQDDNVPNESFENWKAVLLPDGSIAMKSVEHILLFDPDELKDVNEPRVITNIKPKMVKILVNGNVIYPAVPFEGNIIVDRAMPRVKHINLKSDQNSISITFSALNYYRPMQTSYRVRVRELGNKWTVYTSHVSSFVDDRGQLHFPMANLEPGDYHIEVQVSMFPDVWEEDIPDDKRFIWEIHVKQPWWKTSGLRVLVGLVLLTLLLLNFYYYNRNTRMRDRRNSEEGDIMRKIRFFVEKCDDYSNMPIAPTHDEMIGSDADSDSTKLTPEFIDLMMKIMPTVKSHQLRTLSMHRLSEVCNVDIVTLYETITSNIYKNPRDLVITMKLRRCAEMLRDTEMTIEQIATENGFYTPNYFLGSFFHAYKMTPAEYRKKEQRKA